MQWVLCGCVVAASCSLLLLSDDLSIYRNIYIYFF